MHNIAALQPMWFGGVSTIRPIEFQSLMASRLSSSSLTALLQDIWQAYSTFALRCKHVRYGKHGEMLYRSESQSSKGAVSDLHLGS